MGFVYGTARGAGGGTAALIRGATPLQLIIASSCGFTCPSKAVPTVRLPLQQTTPTAGSTASACLDRWPNGLGGLLLA